jgi:hypothetical protein
MATPFDTSSASAVGRLHEGWACYHTELLTFDLDGVGEAGIIGSAVGAPFAVLVAEQLFVSGCRLLISVTSAGRITGSGPTPYFVLIDRALRDEGMSYHYLPPAKFAEAPDARLLARVEEGLSSLPGIAVYRAPPGRRTRPIEKPIARSDQRVSRARSRWKWKQLLYTPSRPQGANRSSASHVTNTMAQAEGDFEKGVADGAMATPAIVAGTARVWSSLQ